MTSGSPYPSYPGPAPSIAPHQPPAPQYQQFNAPYPGAPRYPQPQRSAPASSLLRGVLGGTAAALIYTVLTVGALVSYQASRDYHSYGGWVVFGLHLASMVAVLGIVLASADRRRVAVGGVLAVAGLLWFVENVIILAVTWNGLSWLADFARQWYFTPSWPTFVVSSLIFATILVAWFLGRRTSLTTLVIVPIAALAYGLVQWLVAHAIQNDLRDRISHVERGSDLSDHLDRVGDLFRHANLVMGIYSTVVTIVFFVAFTWLAVGLDKLLSQTGQRP
ncbi:hypothetical protein HUN08_14335 [Gordonia sp. X0973]|uniref:hypothetical protein n=1 Tax=Gordonia sp. X0973 TaxID=2742602 RepID=UPI000F539F41|nr:hypothetical protein [Gordonia sp. X0973]QKT08243.1 hypothetical protein HUN08_14335 [Gordonia sp. X0973]